MCNSSSNQILDFSPVRFLQRTKTTDVKRLKQIRRIRRHTESKDVVLPVVFLELVGVVASVAVKDKKAINTYISRTRELVEVT